MVFMKDEISECFDFVPRIGLLFEYLIINMTSCLTYDCKLIQAGGDCFLILEE